MSKILIIEDEAAIRRVLTKNTLKKMILIRLKKPKMVLQVSKNKEQRLRFGFVRHQNAKMDGVEVLEAVKKSNPKFYGDDFRSWRYGNGN
jgi:DNA-binding NtrC family response regulator